MKFTLDNIELWHMPKDIITKRICEKIAFEKNVTIEVDSLGFMEFNDLIIGIDSDCNFVGFPKVTHLKSGRLRHYIEFSCRIKHHKEGSYTIRMDHPDFTHMAYWDNFIDLAETVKVPIKEFIRYNYNPRIIKNQKRLLEFLNEIKK